MALLRSPGIAALVKSSGALHCRPDKARESLVTALFLFCITHLGLIQLGVILSTVLFTALACWPFVGTEMKRIKLGVSESATRSSPRAIPSEARIEQLLGLSRRLVSCVPHSKSGQCAHFRAWAAQMARNKSLVHAEQLVARTVSLQLMQQVFAEWVSAMQQSAKKRLLETIQLASADYQSLRAQHDELEKMLKGERATQEELRLQLEREREEHVEQLEASQKERELELAMLRAENDGIATARYALAASVEVSAGQAEDIEQDLQRMVTALEGILLTTAATAASAEAKSSPATPSIDYSRRSERGTPLQRKVGEAGANISRNGEADSAPADWKQQMAQQAELLRTANREIANLKRSLKNTLSPSPKTRNTSAGDGSSDAEPLGSRGAHEAMSPETEKKDFSQQGRPAERQLLLAENSALQKKVKVLEVALDDIGTSLDKTCAILRIQATSLVQSGSSAHVLAVKKARQDEADLDVARKEKDALQVHLQVLQEALEAEQLACRQAESQAKRLSAAAMTGDVDRGADLSVSAPSVASLAADCSKRMRDAWAQNDILMRALEVEKERTSQLQELVTQLQA